MSEQKNNRLHHRGRLHQIPIYLGKQFRSFLYMNDWKMLPMAAVIAALVSMVIRRKFMITMEGTLIGAFALTCVAIWNGCFNSIQVICRERPIVKREHRSGMHITSYVFSNMVYQACLCLAQTAVSLYVCQAAGVHFEGEGTLTPFLIVDIGITVFLITFASDMLSLFVSSLAHTTTGAMTVMPFILIFQLVFSGGIFALPNWTKDLKYLTISHYGMTCIAAQGDYNNQPMMTGWETLEKAGGQEIKGTLTVGQLLDILESDKGMMKNLRTYPVTIYNPDWLPDFLKPEAEATPEVTAAPPEGETAAEVTAASAEATAAPQEGKSVSLKDSEGMENFDFGKDKLTMPLGDVLDLVMNVADVEKYRDVSYDFSFTVDSVIDTLDREKIRETIINATTKAMYKSEYAREDQNIYRPWVILFCYAMFFALASVIALEFIDKDKR